MIINISGKNIQIGESLKEHIEDKLKVSANKYLISVTRAEIVISKVSYFFHTNILIHDTSIGDIKASDENDEVYASFDNALVKIEKILRKYRDKIKKNVKKNHKDEALYNDIKGLSAKKYILQKGEYQIDFDNTTTNLNEPITIAEKATNISKLTVSEAIMKMDFENLPALLFINVANNRLNVVYHRKDGNISWVDPENI